MEPCQFCGQLAAVDGAGFCTHCRNYRGVPAQPPGQGYPTAPGYPASAAPYPTSAPSYGGQVSSPPYGPVSGGPVSGGGYPTGYPPAGYQAAPPTSYPPAPTTGYPAPGYQPAGMPVSAPVGVMGTPTGPPKQRSPFLIPIIAVCTVLALLAVSIVVVVLVRHSDKKKPPAVASNGFDQCLVGKWSVTDYTTRISFDNVGEVLFLADDINETLDIKADGSATDDYGTSSKPTTLIGAGGGHTYKISVYGTVTYKMASANGTLTFSDAVPDGKLLLEIDGADSGTTDLSVSNDPTPYTCTSTTFSQQTSDFTATAKKTS
jgi:hypothetical protein